MESKVVLKTQNSARNQTLTFSQLIQKFTMFLFSGRENETSILGITAPINKNLVNACILSTIFGA